VGDHERRPLERLDRPGHRHRLARSGRPEQRRETVAGADRLRDLLDRARLVGGRGEGGIEPERGHQSSIADRNDGLGDTGPGAGSYSPYCLR
jgi:hypothetical protein